MRHLLLPAAALTLAIAPLAHADVYDLNFQGTLYSRAAPEQIDEDFCLDSDNLLPESSPYNRYCVERNVSCFIAIGTEVVDVGQQLTPTYYLVTPTYLNIFYGDTPGGPDDSDFGPYTFSSQTPGAPFTLFTGASESPILTTGTFNFSTYGYHYLLSGPVTITDLTTSPVPEPSTLTLLGTGALGLAAALRRRLAQR